MGSVRTSILEDLDVYPRTSRRPSTTPSTAKSRETLTAAVGSIPPGRLHPVLETRYHRTTLYLPESGSRATIDTDVTWQRPGRAAWVLDDAVILETKSGSTAGPLDRHLWAHGVRPSRISKFATGMAALCPDLPANRWNRTLRRSLSLRPAA
ncbi:VTC domain-containing protein, partial [Pseudarthrobacter oxydans]|uniref:VTC domain-containing protein n=1 Tax=Pseudarthrobacter oxydans TaxID=1671 RepID=UPI00380B0039